MKVYQGIIKKVPTQIQFEQYAIGDLDLNTVNLIDTVQTYEKGERLIEYINIRLTFKELDNEGNEKYILNGETQEYEKVYKRTPILRAYGKEMRILLEIGEYAPVKIIANEVETEGTYKQYNVICIQDQRTGKNLSV